jgi:chromosome segregation ATPase
MAVEDSNHDVRITLLEKGGERLEKTLSSLEQSQKEISQSLAALVTLEHKHQETRSALERAFTSIKEQEVKSDIIDGRLIEIEKEMPQLKETRQWVVTGVLAVCGVVFMSLLALVIVSSKGPVV